MEIEIKYQLYIYEGDTELFSYFSKTPFPTYREGDAIWPANMDGPYMIKGVLHTLEEHTPSINDLPCLICRTEIYLGEKRHK